MLEGKRDARVRTRTVTVWAMSALLAMQLMGTALPTAIAQEAGSSQGQSGRVTEEMEPDGTAQVSTPGPQKNEGASRQTDTPASAIPSGQGAPSQGEGEMGVEENVSGDGDVAAPLSTQGTQVSVTYVDESGGPATRGEYTLITGEPEGDASLTLEDGDWYVVLASV